MNRRLQRIGLILLMVAALAYTLYNYTTGRTTMGHVIIICGMMAFFLTGQVAALIREWKEE